MRRPSLNCKETVELVTDYLEGALLPELQAQLEQHLDGCPGCTTYLAQMRQTIQTLRTLTDETTPSTSRQQLLQTFRDWRQTHSGGADAAPPQNGLR